MQIVYIPCSSEQEAEKISEILVKERLAACANIIKSKSIYEWENNLNKTDEWIILAKTLPEKFREIEEKVKEIHSYDLPCIIGIPIVDFNEEYLAWVKDQL